MNAIRPRVKHICKIIYAPSRGYVSLQKLRQIGSRQLHDIESRPPGQLPYYSALGNVPGTYHPPGFKGPRFLARRMH